MPDGGAPGPRLAEIAERRFAIEQAAVIAPPADVRLGATFAGSASVGLFQPRRHSVSVELHELRDTVLLGALMMLLKDGRGVQETHYLVHPTEWSGICDGPPQDAPRRASDDVRVVIGANRNFLNHYHWIAQAVPAIDHALRAPSDRPLVLALPDGWGRLHEDTLRLLGHGDATVLRIEPYAPYLLPHVRYADFLWGMTAFDVSHAARETYGRLAAGMRDMPTARDLLYVSRVDSENRRVVNEAEVIELMRGLGASIVECSQLTLAQQINLFRNARVVVGPHGAGLSNIAFCRPGAIVYEFIPSGYANCCYNALAQGCRLSYWADMFESHAAPGVDVHDMPWTVGLGTVERRMGEILRADQARAPGRLASGQPASGLT